MAYLGRACQKVPTVLFENIFIGAKDSLGSPGMLGFYPPAPPETDLLPLFLSALSPYHAGILPAHSTCNRSALFVCFCLLSHPKLCKCPVLTFVTTWELEQERPAGVFSAHAFSPL